MKILKPVISFLVIASVVYLFLLIVTGVVLYQNKPGIEKEAARALGADKVVITDFFNLPFVMAEARNILVVSSNGIFVRVEHLRFYYNILKMPFVGPVRSVNRITAGKAEIASDRLGDLKPFRSLSFGTNAGNVSNAGYIGLLDLNIGFHAEELSLRSGPRLGIHAGADLRNLDFRLKKGNLHLDTVLQIYARISNQVELFRSTVRAGMTLALSNFSGTGQLFVTNIDLGGVTLLENEKIPFNISNGFLPDIEHSVLSNIISRDGDGTVRFRFEKNFKLSYEPYREYSILEYMLEPGDYHLRMTADFRNKGFTSSAEVTPVSNQRKKWISFDAGSENGGISLNAGIHTAKYGQADIRMNFVNGNSFPSVSARLNNLFLMDGLRVGGEITVASSGRKSRVTADSIRINGGPIGSAHTVMNFRDDGIVLTSPAGGFNGNISGWIREEGFELNIQGNNLSGSAAVSNIYLNFMGIGQCTVNGAMKVVNDGSDYFVITASATGYRKVPGAGPQKYVNTDLRFSSRDLVLSFPKIEFPASRLSFAADFLFTVYDRSRGTIDISGGVNVFHQYDLPLSGKIDFDSLRSSVNADFSLDENIRVKADVVRNSLTVGITSASYPLKKIGYDGVLDFDFRASLDRDIIRDIRIRTQYGISGKMFSFLFKAERDKDLLKVKQFLLDNRDDKLVATGNLWQSGGRLFGQFDFIRAGKISFSSTFDDIIGSIDLHNWYFKDFLKEGGDVFASLKADFNGPLILPDINGSLRIVNTANSGKFAVDLPVIQKRGPDVLLRNASFRDAQNQADMTAKLTPTGDGFIFSGEGNFNIHNTFRGKAAFSYFAQTNQSSVSYDVSSLSVGGKDLKSLSGGFIWKGGRYTFFKKGEYGISGYYYSKNNFREWSMDAIDQDMQGSFSGEVRNGRIKSDLVVQAQLYYLGFFDILKDLSGEGKVVLKIQGTPESPLVNGSLRLYKANIGIVSADTRIRDLNINLGIENSKVIFNNYPVTTSSGNFLVKGFVDLKDILIPYFELALLPYDKKLPVFTLNYNTAAMKLAGDITVSNLFVSGTPSALFLGGNVTADNGLVMLSGLNSPSEENKLPPLIENIRWNLPIRIGNSVKFSNEFVDVILKKDDILLLTGDFANNSFTLKGKVGVDRGSLTYLGRDFIVKEGTAYFYGVPGDPYPYVNLSSTFRYRDEKNEYVDVYLTFEGKLSTIVVRDFYSSPSKSRSELSAVLGLKSDDFVSGTNALLSSGVNVAENIWFFNPLGSDLRRRLGLDLFTIRTGFFENWARKAVAGDTNVNLVNMWEGTSLVVGKYLLPNVFIQYEMTIARNPYATMELVPLHSFGVDFDLRYFDLGWKYEPVSDLGKGVIYENKFELNFNRQF